MKMSEKPTKLVIAAIDFGTTYSGYAYSFYHTLQKEPLKVYVNEWSDGNGKLQTSKAPTTVLFNPDRVFDSFGFQAEKKYAELADDDKHHGWRYFKHFKMNLHGTKLLSRNMRIKDDQGKRMHAVDVFSAAIKFIKDHLFQTIKMKAKGIDENDIYWVITVPAIWQYSAKQFMKEASLKAGISANQFMFAVEPEAAAIFCKHYENVKSGEGTDTVLKSFSPGSQFMVIDMGGGTVDITTSEVQEDGYLKEIYFPSGRPFGGTLVDKQIHDFFEEIFIPKVWKNFKAKEKADYLDFLVMLEAKKRQDHTSSGEDIRITLPQSLLELFKEENDFKGTSHLACDKFVEKVTLTRNKLRIKTETFVQLFNNTKHLLIEHLRTLLDIPELKGVSTLMMVGGFSESQVMHNAVMEAFPGKHVIIPEESGTAVMRGAVLFGFNKNTIRSRKAPFSYGIAKGVPYDPEVHPKGRSYNGKMEDVFHPFIRKGQELAAGMSVEHSFTTPLQGTAVVEIYQTQADDLPEPSYTYQPDFERIGELQISPCKQGQVIDVTMRFDDIELMVEALEHGTNNRIEAQFEFLR